MKKTNSNYICNKSKKLSFCLILLLQFILTEPPTELYAEGTIYKRLDSLEHCLSVQSFLIQKAIEIKEGIHSFSREDLNDIIKLNQVLINFVNYEIDYDKREDLKRGGYNSKFKEFYDVSNELIRSIEEEYNSKPEEFSNEPNELMRQRNLQLVPPKVKDLRIVE